MELVSKGSLILKLKDLPVVVDASDFVHRSISDNRFLAKLEHSEPRFAVNRRQTVSVVVDEHLEVEIYIGDFLSQIE